MKHKKKSFYILIIFVSVLFVFLLFNIAGRIRVNRFFKRYPEKIIIWDFPSDKMIISMADKFLGKDVEFKIYNIIPGFHYWKIAQENSVDIDTIIGCNPFLKSLNAYVGDKIIAINKKGVLHYVQQIEQVDVLSKLYNVKISKITKNNKIGLFSKLKKCDIIFIPGAMAKVLTREMNVLFKKRRMFKVPTNGWVAGRPFGMQMHPILKKMRFHKGIDMKCPKGTPIFASAAGVVIYAGSAGTYGRLIKIKHNNGYETRYAHCSRIFVKIGQQVKERQIIGRVGGTGMATIPHLHFEVRINGKPIDPMKFLW